MTKKINKTLSLFKNNLAIVFAVIAACILLLLMNYYTIRILSGTRAYMSGESFYAKGQKDASINLLRYLDTKDEIYWKLFEENIAVPLSDKRARIALLEKKFTKAKKLFIKGKNHPEDAPLMVWLFKWFQEFNFMKKPIVLWTTADSIITNTNKLGQQIHKDLSDASISIEEKEEFRNTVYNNNQLLTKLENQFLESLGKTSREIAGLILLLNTIFIVSIVIGQSFFSMRTVNKLSKSGMRLIEQNKELKSTNHELDRFVYSASHDLRAPIASLKGLLQLMRLEATSPTLENYINLMGKSLEKQDAFIKKIISFSQNKRSALEITDVNIDQAINEVLDQLRFGKHFSRTTLEKYTSVKNFKTDSIRLEIILSNLLSNAFKYQDPSKEQNWVKIVSLIEENRLVITISDNGIGIDKSNLTRVFDLFYRSTNISEGSGVGLYIVKEAVEKLNGDIKMDSEKGSGTSFTLTFPEKK